MGTPHHVRDHARWAASSTAANVACPGRLTLIEEMDYEDVESEAAAWGTACHQVSEKCLRGGFDADTLIGTTEKTKKFEFEVDEEMAETAMMYVGYVRQRMADYLTETGHNNAVLMIEKQFSLEALKPPFEAGGTGDSVLYFPAWKLLEVVDLKGGRGVVVEVVNNMQLRTYGLGALLSLPGLDIDEVMVTIVQPRAHHKSGRIRSEPPFHVADLIEWTTALLASMQLSAQALRDRTEMGEMQWHTTYVHAGDHCKFCPVLPTCPAVKQKALDAARVWFNDLDKPVIGNAPEKSTEQELADTLDLLDMIENWIKQTRAYAHTRAEMGAQIPSYMLVEKEGREKWKEGVEDKVEAIAGMHLARDKFINPGKLKTPKQIRKALGKKAELLKGMSVTPKTGTNLVRVDKTDREAATPAVNKFFSSIE